MEQLKIQGRSPAVFMLSDCASTFDVGMDFISLFLSCPGAAGKKDILLEVKCLQGSI